MVTRPPTSGKPSGARSTMVPLTVVRSASQGLTVCRSEEATSNGWPAISARAKSETRCWATSREPGRAQRRQAAPAAKPRARRGGHRERARCRAMPPPERNDRRGRGGGRLRRGSCRSGRGQRGDTVGKRLRGPSRDAWRRTASRERRGAGTLRRARDPRPIPARTRASPGVKLPVEGRVKPQRSIVGLGVGHGSSLKVLASRRAPATIWTSPCRSAPQSLRRSRERRGR